jgi:hypothetical protein
MKDRQNSPLKEILPLVTDYDEDAVTCDQLKTTSDEGSRVFISLLHLLRVMRIRAFVRRGETAI